MGGTIKKPTTEKTTRDIRAPIKVFFTVELDLNCLSLAATFINYILIHVYCPVKPFYSYVIEGRCRLIGIFF